MNLKETKEMITLMNDNNLTELEIEREGLKLRLRKGNGGKPEYEIFQPVASAAQAGVAVSEQPPKQAAAVANGLTIKAPMVGTFYRAPSPEAPPYVESGSIVEVGQVVCIIEAMKLMNEIKADKKGRLIEVLIENGQPVEFGQELFRMEPV